MSFLYQAERRSQVALELAAQWRQWYGQWIASRSSGNSDPVTNLPAHRYRIVLQKELCISCEGRLAKQSPSSAKLSAMYVDFRGIHSTQEPVSPSPMLMALLDVDGGPFVHWLLSRSHLQMSTVFDQHVTGAKSQVILGGVPRQLAFDCERVQVQRSIQDPILASRHNTMLLGTMCGFTEQITHQCNPTDMST